MPVGKASVYNHACKAVMLIMPENSLKMQREHAILSPNENTAVLAALQDGTQGQCFKLNVISACQHVPNGNANMLMAVGIMFAILIIFVQCVSMLASANQQ